MRRLTRFAAVAVAALLLTGCLPLSLAPLYTGPGDLVFDEALLGTWVPPAEEGKDLSVWGTWTIERDEHDTPRYRIRVAGTVDEKTFTTTFVAHLVKVGDGLFLDLFPVAQEPDPGIGPWMALHLATCHSFMPIKIDGKDGFTLQPVDLDKLAKKLKAQPDLVAHHFAQDDDGDDAALIFTADSKALQAFVRDHLTADLLSDAQPFRRAEAKPVTPPTR